MITDALPPTTNFGAWTETVEFSDTEDNSLIDFSIYPEITLSVIDPYSQAHVLVLTKTRGQITTPSPGVIEWYVEMGVMNGLKPGPYDVRLVAQIDTAQNLLPLMRSSISVVS